MVTIPVPPRPDHVRVEWTPTNAAVVVTCDRCKVHTSIYTTALLRDPDCLGKAVAEHLSCVEGSPTPLRARPLEDVLMHPEHKAEVARLRAEVESLRRERDKARTERNLYLESYGQALAAGEMLRRERDALREQAGKFSDAMMLYLEQAKKERAERDALREALRECVDHLIERNPDRDWCGMCATEDGPVPCQTLDRARSALRATEGPELDITVVAEEPHT